MILTTQSVITRCYWLQRIRRDVTRESLLLLYSAASLFLHIWQSPVPRARSVKSYGILALEPRPPIGQV
jgi:hypothetical protein